MDSGLVAAPPRGRQHGCYELQSATDAARLYVHTPGMT